MRPSAQSDPDEMSARMRRSHLKWTFVYVCSLLVASWIVYEARGHVGGQVWHVLLDVLNIQAATLIVFEVAFQMSDLHRYREERMVNSEIDDLYPDVCVRAEEAGNSMLINWRKGEEP